MSVGKAPGNPLVWPAARVSSGDSRDNRFAAERDEYGADTMTEIHIVGRIVLNLWRVMKTEVSVLT